MKIYEYDGQWYNLDQLVSFGEAFGTGETAWKSTSNGRVLFLIFSGGFRVELPLAERERIERLIRPPQQ